MFLCSIQAGYMNNSSMNLRRKHLSYDMCMF